MSVALPAGASAASITFTAPTAARAYPDRSEAPAGYDEALAFRTTGTRPIIGITADNGGSPSMVTSCSVTSTASS